jgi:glycosyltransferase involved in cell wall biosynthesis
MADVIEHGQNGLLATELSPRAFADQIRMLTDGSVSCASRSSIAEAARVRFDPAKQAAAYVALFQSVVKHD